ncbi:sugar transferase [Lactiplantibacillus pentosus]|jgi:lipopolysaccharide/colanic/teichoic acid biosynthesis glycosyltransferase|uniref:sugar transferase n=1 Tax=Lactiplantibacillus pentosus TaxID=1589 RepID=UPI003C2FC647
MEITKKKSSVRQNMRVYFVSKRILDIVLSLCALAILSLVFLAVFIIDRFGENKGPMFYKQVRVGLHGKSFKIIKFRSMIVDADKKLRENTKLYQEYKDNNYKLPEGKDPRVTKVGSLLRKSSLDEIPQFINVLKGEMSLIGPRPIVSEELAEYGERTSELLSVKPGAMGYWQATGRSNIGYPERCDIELYYVANQSFWFDVKIFFKNMISIFKSDGAF